LWFVARIADHEVGLLLEGEKSAMRMKAL